MESTKNGNKIEADFLITNDCNLRCKHCLYRNDLEHPKYMSVNDFKEFENYFKDYDIEYHLLGGEPLCNPNLTAIVQFLESQTKYKQILTNGKSLDADLFKVLKDSNINSIGFSLEGNQCTHDSNRKKGSYNEVINGIQLCVQNGIMPKISTCVHSNNIHAIKEMIMTLSNYGIKRILLEYFVPIGHNYQMQIISPEEWKMFLEEIKNFNKDYGLHIIAQKVYYNSSVTDKSQNPCVCIDGKYPVIDSQGNYYPCILFYAVNCHMTNILSSNRIPHQKLLQEIPHFCQKLYEENININNKFGFHIHCPAILYALKHEMIDPKALNNCTEEIGCFHIIEKLY